MRQSSAYRPTGQIGLRHAVPGLISYTVILLSIIGVLWVPRTWVLVATFFLAYFIARMAATFVFALVGDARMRAWERTD